MCPQRAEVGNPKAYRQRRPRHEREGHTHGTNQLRFSTTVKPRNVAGSLSEPRPRGATLCGRPPRQESGNLESCPSRRAFGSSGFQLSSFSPAPRGPAGARCAGPAAPPRTRARTQPEWPRWARAGGGHDGPMGPRRASPRATPVHVRIGSRYALLDRMPDRLAPKCKTRFCSRRPPSRTIEYKCAKERPVP